MAESNNGVAKKESAPSAENVSTRVTVAFPFSQIKIQQPSEDVAALAVLVQELAEALAEVAPGAKAAELANRAQTLAARLA